MRSLEERMEKPEHRVRPYRPSARSSDGSGQCAAQRTRSVPHKLRLHRLRTCSQLSLARWVRVYLRPAEEQMHLLDERATAHCVRSRLHEERDARPTMQTNSHDDKTRLLSVRSRFVRRRTR
jgi:hypothetical protein